MFPTGSRIGYSIMPRAHSIDSLGLRYTATILDNIFIAKYSAPLHSVAFWIRYIVGTPQRGDITLRLYEDGGSINNPGTLLETVSGGSGTFSPGRIVFSGFNSTLVKGRRYRLRLTTSNNVDNNYGEFLLGQPIEVGDFNESPYCGDIWQLKWQGVDSNYNRYNTQVFQTVGGQQVSRDLLLASSGQYSLSTTYNSYTSSPFGVRFTAPPGPTLRYAGLIVNRTSPTGAAAHHGYWRVLKGSTVIGVTGVHPGFGSSDVPDSSPHWGLRLYRFTKPLELEGGETYDFIFDVAGAHDSSNYSNFIAHIIDPTYVPAWAQRYRLLVNGNVVNDRMLSTFMLILDDVQPLPDASGIVNPYVMLPVG